MQWKAQETEPATQLSLRVAGLPDCMAECREAIKEQGQSMITVQHDKGTRQAADDVLYWQSKAREAKQSKENSWENRSE
jgi:hypothetical protein